MSLYFSAQTRLTSRPNNWLHFKWGYPMSVQPLSLLLVDDFVPFRTAVRELCEKYYFLKVVGEAGDGHAAVEMAFQLSPHVILMDVKMPGLNGIEATQRIKTALPHIHVIGMSLQGDTRTREEMKAAGCSDFMDKELAPELPCILAKITGTELREAA